MGTLCGSVFGNISIGKFEKLHIYSYLRNFSFLWNGTKLKQSNLQTNLTKHPKQPGHCSPCPSRLNNPCCRQMKETFGTKHTFQIFQNITCKSESLIYLLQCRICQLQYHGNNETPLNIRLNNCQRKMANWKPQFQRGNISTKKTIIFNNMLNSLLLSKLKKKKTTEETRTHLERR